MIYAWFVVYNGVVQIYDVIFLRIGRLNCVIKFICAIPFFLSKRKKTKRGQPKSSSYSFSGLSSPIPISTGEFSLKPGLSGVLHSLVIVSSSHVTVVT